MRIRTGDVNTLIDQCLKLWRLEEWTVEWQFGECEREGDVEIRFTEKYMLITLDKKQITGYENLRRTVAHEIGHALLEVIDRNLSDFVDHHIKSLRMRKIFWERLNTDENVVIDHIVCRIFNL